MNNFYKNIIFLSLLFCSPAAFGSGTNFNDTTNKAAPSNNPSFTGNVGVDTFIPLSALNVNGGVGIGTTLTNGAYINGNAAPSGGLIVQGNVGIGTFNPFGGNLIINGGGNVGIGSLAPGQRLDVQGTVRTAGFTMSGQTPVSGYVLTASDSAGDATWASEGAIGGWTVSGNNVYETKGGNVGIGTIWPVAQLAVSGNGVGIGTNMNDMYLTTTPPSGGMIIEGNVGIGTPAPMDAIQIGNQWIFENGGYKVIGYNTWYNPSNGQDTYFLNGPASRVAQTSNGEVLMQVAGTGTAGAFQTWADGARLYANGNFGVGGTGLSAMPAAGSQLAVYGGTSLGVDYFTTAATTNGLIVEGNVGIGTFNPFGGNLIINGGGNVGIGSLAPNGALDVGAGAICLGHVCDSTWPAGGANYWLLNGGSNVGINTTQAVGIGTTFVGGTGEAKLSIMNGNVGIGTWVPSYTLEVAGAINGSIGILSSQNNQAQLWFGYPGQFRGRIQYSNDSSDQLSLISSGIISFSTNAAGSNAMTLDSNGNLGIGTATPVGGLAVMNGNVGIGTWIVDGGGLIVAGGQGNVGIGSIRPGQALDVKGTVRMTGLTLTGNGAGAGNVMVSNTVGIGTWMSPSSIGAGGAGTNYWSLNGGSNVGINTTQAVGIGTSFVGGTGEATLSVMNGNVGIGTWVPSDRFQIGKYQSTISGFEVDSNGNVGIGTTITNNAPLVIMNGNLGIGTWAPAYTLESMAGDWHIGNFASLWIDSGSVINFGPKGSAIPQVQGGFLTPTNYLKLSIDGTSDSLAIDGNGNIGIGTDTPIGGFLITNGNVGIGTWTALGGQLILRGPGNVGIGSAWPGKTLDINGTARMTGFTLTGNGAGAGNVMVSNTVGIGTWMSPSSIGAGGAGTNYWLNNSGGNVGISTIYAVGIGTTFVGGTGEGALTVMNGNVGIGTWLPQSSLAVMNGNVGIGTLSASFPLEVVNSNGLPAIFGYNTTGFGYGVEGISDTGVGVDAISGGASGADYALMARQYGGGSAAYFLGGSTATTPTVIIQQATGGSADLLQAQNTTAISLVNITSTGNVGIGTWVPASALQVAGNVGIGTNAAGSTPRTLRINNIAVFNTEYNNGSPASPITINWANGNKQAVTLTAAGMTVNFTNPPVGVGAFQLKVIQDGTGSRTVTTWSPSSGNIYWSGGSAPTLTTTASYLDIVSCYYDGTNYYCATTLNFQ